MCTVRAPYVHTALRIGDGLELSSKCYRSKCYREEAARKPRHKNDENLPFKAYSQVFVPVAIYRERGSYRSNLEERRRNRGRR